MCIIQVTAGTDKSGKITDIMIARAKFSEEYCKSNGWPIDPTELSFEQILEIREQPGWINPLDTI